MSKTRKVVVITGASAGVGRATAHAFAKKGARIGLIARSIEQLEATRKEVEQLGGEAMCLPLDVADFERVEAAARQVEEHWGPMDIWVNDAMVSVFSPVKEMKAEEYRRVIEVNYLGYVHGTMVALKRMLPRDRGVIIQVSSALAFRSIPLQSAYCASKHAVKGFTESLRTELLHDRSKVRVTLVHLPAVNTPQFDWVKSRLPNRPQPVPPIFQPEVPAQAIVWASEHPRREISVAFPTVKAIIAEKIVPWIADGYLAKTGYESQQTAEPASPERKDNVWEPIHEDRGEHGAFDSRAKNFSLQLWLNENRRWLSLGTVFAAVASGVLWKRRAP